MANKSICNYIIPGEHEFNSHEDHQEEYEEIKI